VIWRRTGPVLTAFWAAVVLALAGVAAASASGWRSTAQAASTATSRVASSGGRTWSVVRTPDLGGGGQLQAVSCVSSSDCTAVGVATGTVGLVEWWNGSTWSVVKSPRGRGEGVLRGVSCLTAADCMAVGLAGAQAAGQGGGVLVERWNGSRWSLVKAPTPAAGGSLSAVSCVSRSDCTAVGQTVLAADLVPFRSKVVVEDWNGSKWSVVMTPAVKGGPGLNGVACVSKSFCIAVGQREHGAVLVERWNGSTWSVVRTPGFQGDGELDAVSCVASSDCTAVGRRYDGPVLVERWNGSRWSIMKTPHIDGDGGLAAVSCLSTSDCTAVGASGLNSDDTSVLVEHWNGLKWSIVNAPTVPGGTEFYGASCESRSVCTAVGQSGDNSSEALPLAEDTTRDLHHSRPWTTKTSAFVRRGSRASGCPDLNRITCVLSVTSRVFFTTPCVLSGALGCPQIGTYLEPCDHSSIGRPTGTVERSHSLIDPSGSGALRARVRL
jgi:hypothetical protein